MTRAARRLSLAVLPAIVVVWQSAAWAQDPTATTDYSQEAVVIEQIRTLLRFEADGTGRRERYTRIRMQSEAGVHQFGQLVFGYNSANERAEIMFVRVRKPDGTIFTTAPTAVQDLSSPVQRIAPVYTDFRQKHVTVQSLRPGDTLEFSMVTVIHTALAPGQFWDEYDFEQDAVVLDEQLDIDVPASRIVALKARPGFESAPEDRDDRRVYHWTRSQLKASAEKKAGHAAKNEGEQRRAAVEPKLPDIRLTTFQTWEQVGQWYAALEAPQRVPTPDVRKKAAELIAGRATDLEKIEALYGFVATNLRYVSLSLGAGRYQPRQAGAVLQQQYGDCKDKHTLLASLIDAAGLKASAALISTSAKLDPDFPSPSQFNHVITLAVAGGEDVWLDTTTEVAPFRLLWSGLRNKQALVVGRAGTRLQLTPANPPMKSIIAQDIEATLGPGGTLNAHVRMTLRGDTELVVRTIFRSIPSARWKEVLESLVDHQGTPGEVANWNVSDPATVRDPFSLEFDLSVARYADWTSNRIAVELPLRSMALIELPENTDDAMVVPVTIGAAPTELSYKLRLALPADVSARPPVPVTFARDYAAYRTTYAVNGTMMTAERLTSIQLSEIPGARRQDYAAFLKVVTTDVGQPLALETSSSMPSAASPSLTAAELDRSGYEAMKAGNFDQAVTLLTRAAELDPQDKLAWNLLGRAHLERHETDAAIHAFDKQIDINPYDEFAYNGLGEAYVSRQDFDRAEAAFLKQLEVNPLNKYTPANLGAVYLERHQYDRAATQFEKAIALNPDESRLQVQVGKAYLNLKQIPQAMAAFGRAVAQAPTPNTWNNIAYELALTGTQLDRAQQYAESAVSSISSASRNMDVARGDAASLDVVRSLGSYWDTLGWVHFARGDMARATPYIEMAWNLAQSAEVGDHLAQIYEKEGRKDDAIRTYALALAASRPASDVRSHLATLLGDPSKVDSVVDAHRTQLTEMRTVRLDATSPTGATAEFLILFTAPATVENVRFVSGDEALRPMADVVRGTSFSRMFPDDGPAKILRRGVVGCTVAGGCALTLILPNDAKPVK
jgi:tetratricopeptide (TPR) repeat protein